MPRPGPMPYECVRRGWHTEVGQCLPSFSRFSGFGVVSDAHSPATKKNKEWQEKLPAVVLKAEEIMYSKANSEAEYLNPDTLNLSLIDQCVIFRILIPNGIEMILGLIRRSFNDAVNTIIRRHETTDTGDLLLPCVEAALNLACKPVRTSKSDRHNNPRISRAHK
ncbi:hypothetical protein E2542_SST28806 [Spatholobus suberectus]|nr:hypothetical protein E2542_SST30730 [Spatholobus suberectus]TKY46758.1 hypothetical protein E2542_SST28806 [Spatholobus suberectus]